jgi:Protein of unknown function (DUF1566)
MATNSKNYGGLILIIILVIAFFTNPNNLQKHKDAVLEYYKEKYVGVSKSNSDLQNAMNSLGNLDKAFLVEFIEPLVSYKNYYVFSLTKFSDKIVGVGLFGKVFVFGNITEENSRAQNNDQSSGQSQQISNPSQQSQNYPTQEQSQQTNNSTPQKPPNHISIGSNAYGGIVSYISKLDGHIEIAAPYDLGEMNWSDALMACKNLNISGYSDWHLPDRNELLNLSLLFEKRVGNIKSSKYWSSYDGGNASVAYIQTFPDGEEYSADKSSILKVRAIRVQK